MRIFALIVCLILGSCARYNYQPTPKPTGYYYDEKFSVLVRERDNEAANYLHWRKNNLNFLFIRDFESINDNDSLFIEPKITIAPPKVPTSTARQDVSRMLFFQFSLDSLGGVKAVELIHQFDDLNFDSAYIKNLVLTKHYGWQEEKLTQADKDFIRETLFAIANWKVVPAQYNGKNKSCIVRTPIKLLIK